MYGVRMVTVTVVSSWVTEKIGVIIALAASASRSTAMAASTADKLPCAGAGSGAVRGRCGDWRPAQHRSTIQVPPPAARTCARRPVRTAPGRVAHGPRAWPRTRLHVVCAPLLERSRPSLPVSSRLRRDRCSWCAAHGRGS